ncbi:MAG: DUF899 domain-containing protein [Pseudomonadales bacterium]|nr:DUF899 domain-containing protein [Pseudomonadales bacterium]
MPAEQDDIQAIEMEIFELTQRLTELRKQAPVTSVPNYSFTTAEGEVSLDDLFGDKDKLLLIHNMGQGCRYCTLWADEINGALAHLEAAMSVVLVSKDEPALQRKFANSRGWRFKLASHNGGAYIQEQTVMAGGGNVPGCVVYARDGHDIVRKNSAIFGPGDLYCSTWNFLALAGLSSAEFTPQYDYWLPPAEMDDGGENLLTGTSS